MPDLQDLLVKTSRTFAVSIPLLPEPTRRSVTIAYLLFRIADTFEDASPWSPQRRVEALADLGDLLAAPADPAAAARRAARWLSGQPFAEHDGYVELVRETPYVLDAYWALPAAAQDRVRHHLSRTLAGMARYVAAGDARGPSLATVEELRDYCYVVAGIVGEMLTDLYLLDEPQLAPVAGDLRGRARWFGEGLQLVNILKDSLTDAAEGRSYLPRGVPREEIFALARRDLELAGEYTRALQAAGAPRGTVAFNALPVLLAGASLDRIAAEGPGAKIGRPRVIAIAAAMERRLDRGEDAVPSRADPPRGVS